MRLGKFIGLSVISLTVGVVTFAALQLNHAAFAVPIFGREMSWGYYNNQQYSQATDECFVFLDGVPTNWETVTTTAQLYVDQMYTYLYDLGTADQVAEGASARASITINTLMGVQADDPRYNANPAIPRWQNGVALAKANFDAWKTIVFAYDAGTIPGAHVEWNTSIHSEVTDTNGAGITPGGGTTNDCRTPRGPAANELPDVFFVDADVETKDAIIFYHPNNTQYAIKKWCGNMTGDEAPFPLNWIHRPIVTGDRIDLTLNPSVEGAIPLTFHGFAENTGSAMSFGGTISGYVRINNSPNPLQLNPPGQAFGPLAAGAFSNPTFPFSYTVPANVTAGTSYCFFTRVTPESVAQPGYKDSDPICYKTTTTRSVAIQGVNGDIHAGGGLCGAAALDTGNITGRAGAGSYGEYVVSGSGDFITNFKSNGSGADTEKLGNAAAGGGYIKACRPDLLAVANAGRTQYAANVIPVNPDGRQSVNMSQLTGNGKPTVWYFDGSELSITGTAPTKVTIVAPNGSIRITGAFLLLNSLTTAATNVPSIGLIAKQDILIDPSVSRADAYMFANGDIDTCAGGGIPGSISCSSSTLVVNGFLMARRLLLNRLGQELSGGVQIGERIALSPQIYLNPPKFFDSNSVMGQLSPQGEKQPLF